MATAAASTADGLTAVVIPEFGSEAYCRGLRLKVNEKKPTEADISGGVGIVKLRLTNDLAILETKFVNKKTGEKSTFGCANIDLSEKTNISLKTKALPRVYNAIRALCARKMSAEQAEVFGDLAKIAVREYKGKTQFTFSTTKFTDGGGASIPVPNIKVEAVVDAATKECADVAPLDVIASLAGDPTVKATVNITMMKMGDMGTPELFVRIESIKILGFERRPPSFDTQIPVSDADMDGLSPTTTGGAQKRTASEDGGGEDGGPTAKRLCV